MASSEREFFPQGVDKGRAALHFKVMRNNDAIKKHKASINEGEFLKFLEDCQTCLDIWAEQAKKAFYEK